MYSVVSSTRRQTKTSELVICYLSTSKSPVRIDQDWECFRLYPAERCLKARKGSNLAYSLVNRVSCLV